MNVAITAENQSLQYDNKQLNALIKEYEQTLETLMSTFRNRAVWFYDYFFITRRTLTGLYKRDVQERELSLIRDYESKLLDREEENATQELDSSTALSESLARLSNVLRQYLRSLGGEEAERVINSDEDREPWSSMAAAQYALERECELARLEKENEELRMMLDMVGYDGRNAVERRSTFDASRMVAPDIEESGVPESVYNNRSP